MDCVTFLPEPCVNFTILQAAIDSRAYSCISMYIYIYEYYVCIRVFVFVLHLVVVVLDVASYESFHIFINNY